MKIDRSNYEIWLIDWLDNNLSDQQVEQLKIFLGENADLREEFEELSRCNLKPSNKSFPHKELLKKSIADITDSQFEYLCVASLENDLSDVQHDELEEIIEKDYEKRKTYDLIQKTRLSPTNIRYKHKNLLLKKTTAQKILRLSVIGLSAAAVITLLITTYLSIPLNLSDEINNTALNLPADTIRNKSSVGVEPDQITEEINPAVTVQKRVMLLAEVQQKNPYLTIADPPVSEPDDSTGIIPDNQHIVLKKIPFNTNVALKGIPLSNTLIASNSFYNIPEYDDRSNLSKFLAKTFREKFLKEETSLNRPVKGYEIAEVGVAGLNKLLGWEMALDKNNDENGELSSVYFSSRILKFNAPVKKSELLP